ncbi:MAG: AMP-binding protein [Ignavibacteriaceae bacterium]|nr:AMP-binding protein [Ignavibacteriaceae bacterium]
MNILYSFKECVEKYPGRNAFCINGSFYTYSEFAKIISGIRLFIDNNITRTSGTPAAIGVTSFNDIETYAAFYAIMFSGFTFVPIDPANPVERNSLMINLAEISTILTSRHDNNISRMANEFTSVKFVNTKELYNSALPANEIGLKLPETKQENAAYILFTSGSTGIPKAVPISNKNVNSFMDAFFALGYKIDENDRFLQSSDLLFDLSTMSYMIPLAKGGCVYTVPDEGIKYVNLYIILIEHEITFALMVPSVLSYLRPFFSEISLEKMRYSLFCGEALYADILTEWSKCVPNALIQNVYGPTEATNFCLTYDWSKDISMNKVYSGIVSIGKPMKNMEAVVVDDNNTVLPENEKGELCLSGLQLTSGYLKNPDKNKSAFFTTKINGEDKTFYKTGDVAFKDENGDFMYCGRKDFQIKIHGYRIELGEIEFHTRQFTSPANAVAIAYLNELGITQIHLFIENFQDQKDKLLEFLKTKIPHYMLPSKITIVNSFPLNANGKVDRKALLETVIG